MKKLWQKNNNLNKTVEEYCSGENVVLDNSLLVYDVKGSIAHAEMLWKIGTISKEEYQKLRKCLTEILGLSKKGGFVIELGDEDVHTKVENYLISKLGDLGKKIHTGRSRNDQVLVDLYLFSKDQILEVTKKALDLAHSFLSFAQKYEMMPMPGYTHMQKAMPSTLGMWSASFAESILNDLELFKTAYKLNDQSPLGSGAAYGVSLAINREMTADILGFSKVQNNSLYCQASRCKNHLAIVQALTQTMLSLSRFAQDLLLFTTAEYDFFTVPEDLCTGSSIMPQKKNLDMMEFVRAKTHVVAQCGQTIASISAGLPSGYNSDFAETKGPFMKAIEITKKSLEIVDLAVSSIKPNTEKLKKSCTPELMATHAAYQLVKDGMAFRKAYQTVARSLDKLPQFDVNEVLKISNHTGGPGNLKLVDIKKELDNAKKWFENKPNNIYKFNNK
jgi:argininosuccinate lyase